MAARMDQKGVVGRERFELSTYGLRVRWLDIKNDYAESALRRPRECAFFTVVQHSDAKPTDQRINSPMSRLRLTQISLADYGIIAWM